jgi:hypothetical protein
MNIKLHFAVIILAISQSLNAQIIIPNADMETWKSVGGANPNMPSGWTSLGGSFPGINKVTTAHSGNYALKLSVAQYFTGVGSETVYEAFGITSITTAPKYFTFWGKLHLKSTDKLNVSADFSKKPSNAIVINIKSTDNVLSSANNSSVWKKFTFGLQTSFFSSADSVYLQFYFSPQLDTASYVIVDDLAFANDTTTGMHDFNNSSRIETSYPNPANTTLNVIYNICGPSTVSLTMCNLLGENASTVFTEKQNSGKYKAEIDISNFPNGVYFANLFVNGRNSMQKIIICH